MMISENDIQRNKLCIFLANLSHKLKSDINVVCVYYTENQEENLIRITILVNNIVNSSNDIIRYLGYDNETSNIKIYLKFDAALKCLNKFYNELDTEFSDSIILFDKTSEFIKLKKEISVSNINKLISIKY